MSYHLGLSQTPMAGQGPAVFCFLTEGMFALAIQKMTSVVNFHLDWVSEALLFLGVVVVVVVKNPWFFKDCRVWRENQTH